MVCPRCGHPGNPAGANFCEDCGESLSAGSPEAAVQPVPTAATSAPVEPQQDSAQEPAPSAPVSYAAEEAATLPFPPPRAAAGWTCKCGGRNPATEQFCAQCGEERQSGTAAPAPGDTFQGYDIIAAGEAGTFRVRPVGSLDGPVEQLHFGSAAELEALRQACAALAPPEGAGPGIPKVVQSGNDELRGDWIVLTASPDGWLTLDQARSQLGANFQSAAGALTELLKAAELAAGAGGLLLLTPESVRTDGSHTFIARPRTVGLPLDGPLLAEPGLIAPELVTRGATADAWKASAFSVGALLAGVTGPGLGFPRQWHRAIAALTSAEPSARPVNAEAVALMFEGADAVAPVVAQRVAMLTDIGRHHPINQDAGGAWSWTLPDGRPVALAVVADGVSAGLHSEDASRIAVQAIHDAVEPLMHGSELTLDSAAAAMLAGGMEAQRLIIQLPFDDPESASSSTLVAVCTIAGEATGIWCGDSRAYGLTPEGMCQLTRDHSWINLAVDRGTMTLDEARRDPRAHVIARWLGPLDPPRDDPGFDSFRHTFVPGEKLLVCSDGLYMYFDPPQWDPKDVVTLSYLDDDQDAAVHRLVSTALDRGGFDNITAAIVAFD